MMEDQDELEYNEIPFVQKKKKNARKFCLFMKKYIDDNAKLTQLYAQNTKKKNIYDKNKT